ncbi:MAG: galactokinase [Propionibacteriaceae bacterium]|nr:galactokinase [Propionibacteriaceae bacterium]
METPGQSVAEAYVAMYGRPAEGVWSAPGRINLIGEHTDYNRGMCLPIALSQRAWLAAGRREDDRLRLASLDLGETVEVALDEIGPGNPPNWAAYLAGVVWAMREAGLTVGGLNAVLSSQVPIGSGLSSSAAIEGCIAVAADALFDLGLTKDDTGRARLAALCQRAENHIVGAPTGGLDQTASLRAPAGMALLIDFDKLDAVGLPSARPVPFDPAADGLILLVINTLAPHANVDGQYAARRAACEAAAVKLGVTSLRAIDLDGLPDALEKFQSEAQVRAVRHIVTENARVVEAVAALQARDWVSFGQLMTAAQASQRDDYRISCPQSDLTCEVAVANGALGARQTGGGFGGCVIALVPLPKVGDVSDAVTKAYDAQGWPHPDIFRA